MKRLSLAARMYLTLLPLVLMGAAVTVITWSSLRDNATPLIRAQNIKGLAITSLSLLLTQTDASKAMILDPENGDSGVRKIKAYDANQAVLKQIQVLSTSPALHSVLSQMQELDDKVLREIDTAVLEALGDGKVEPAKRLYFEKFEPARSRYEALVKKMVEIAGAESDEAASHLKLANSRSLRNICGALAIGIVLVAFPLIYLARFISHRMNAIVSTLEKEAAAANQSSTVFAQSSQALSLNATSTAASLEETGAAVTEISTTIRSCSEHSVHARDCSQKTTAQADVAVAEMQQMHAAMAEMKVASTGISKIIRVIDEIAFQTNILALNAAIEAARAGEAGLGFSVVADEVRRLAQRSTEAARDTASLIQAAITKSEQGGAITTRVGAALERITTDTREVNRVVAEISEGCNQVDFGIRQIGEALSQIELTTQTNAHEAETGSRAADALRTQSLSVEDVVKQLIYLVASSHRETQIAVAVEGDGV
jgi:methyl-accepting chemotaxis protein